MPDAKQDLPPADAWKVVGSPARRASINPDTAELPKNSDFSTRARAASIPGFAFQVDPEGPPPPGLGETVQNIWADNQLDDQAALEAQDRLRNIPVRKTPEVSEMSEQEYLEMPKHRSRSKSSSAVFGTEDPFLPQPVPDMSSIWRNPQQPLHRRASTQPSQQTLMWEALRAAQLATPSDLNGLHTDELMDRFKTEQAATARRFSVAPSMVNRFMSRNVEQENGPIEPGRRRHSVTGGALNAKFLSEGFEKMGLKDSASQLEKIDDYFENTESRTRAYMEAGKNLQANHEASAVPYTPSPATPTSYRWPLYVVEFKAGRTDYFYIPEEYDNMTISLGDLAIVEADRGKDLGKVVEVGISSLAELQMYQATHIDPLVDSHNAVGKEIQPKRIYRLAEPSEVAMLLSKSQDEAKANGLCQVKIRQKKLPMEIVDAEYQWDRRKLTFYFVADRRIDFRELVRELFKIYKTRIWM